MIPQAKPDMDKSGSTKLRGLWTGLVSYGALFMLLAGRLPLTDPGILPPASVPPWAQGILFAHALLQSVYSHAGLLVLGLVILVNRHNLGKLNIDAAFPFLFIWGTVAFSFANPGPLGWAAAVLAVCLPLWFRRDDPGPGKIQPHTLQWIGATLIAFCICLVWVRGILDSQMMRSALHWILIDFPPNVVMEEIVFRGLLWMFLKLLGCADGPVVAVQATLFWLAHASYVLTDPVGFWVIVPVLSLALGVIVWRTRSLTASTVAHLGMNACWSLLMYAAM